MASKTGLSAGVLANIRAELARRSISQKELARRVGQSQKYVSRRLRGETALSLDELVAWADAIGVTVAELLVVAA